MIQIQPLLFVASVTCMDGFFFFFGFVIWCDGETGTYIYRLLFYINWGKYRRWDLWNWVDPFGVVVLPRIWMSTNVLYGEYTHRLNNFHFSCLNAVYLSTVPCPIS